MTTLKPATDRWVRIATTPDDKPGTGKWVKKTVPADAAQPITDRWVRETTTPDDKPGTGRWVKRPLTEDSSATIAVVTELAPTPVRRAHESPLQQVVTLIWLAIGMALVEIEVLAWLHDEWFAQVMKSLQAELLGRPAPDGELLSRIDHVLHLLIAGVAVWWFSRLPGLRRLRRLPRIGYAAAIVATIATIDEFVQNFCPQRTAEFDDWLCSMLGVILMANLLYAWASWRRPATTRIVDPQPRARTTDHR